MASDIVRSLISSHKSKKRSLFVYFPYLRVYVCRHSQEIYENIKFMKIETHSSPNRYPLAMPPAKNLKMIRDDDDARTELYAKMRKKNKMRFPSIFRGKMLKLAEFRRISKNQLCAAHSEERKAIKVMR